MNNIQKAFKNKAKCGLRMAQGGLLTPAQYGDSSEAGLQTRLQALQTQPVQAAGTKPAGDPAGSVGIMNDPTEAENAEKTARWRQDELIKKAAYSPDMRGSMDISSMAIAAPKPVSSDPTHALNAERSARWREDDLMSQMRYGNRGLRMAEGGIVRGEGGPTDDEVPMRVAGKDVHLSNTEAVLPAKTVKALGGPEAVEELIEHTNGKPPVKGGLRSGGEYYTGTAGDTIDPRELRPEFKSQVQAAPIQPAANAGLEAARTNRASAALSALPEAKYPAPGASAASAAKSALPLAQRAKNAALGFLSNPVVDAATIGPAVAKGMSDMVDSFPSLRGQHTAEATDMSVAGTPQQKAVEDAALNARDDNWEVVHGKKLDPSLRKGGPVQAPVAAEAPQTTSFDLPAIDKASAKAATERAIDKASPNTPAGAEALQARMGLRTAQQNGLDNDILSQAKDNGGRVTFSGDKDATAYKLPPGLQGGFVTSKGGAKTTFLDGQASQADAARDRDFEAKGYSKDAFGNWMTPQRLGEQQALEKLQRSNAERVAFGQDITDPNAQAVAQSQVANFRQQDALKEAVGLRRDAAAQARFRDEALAKHYDNLDTNARTDSQIKLEERRIQAKKDAATSQAKRRDDINQALGVYAGDDKDLHARLQRYADRNIKDDGTLTPSQVAAATADQLQLDEALGKAGKHLFTVEEGFDGVVPGAYQKAPLSLGDALRAGAGQKYLDRDSGRVIYDSDIPKNLRQAWLARQADGQAAANKTSK